MDWGEGWWAGVSPGLPCFRKTNGLVTVLNQTNWFLIGLLVFPSVSSFPPKALKNNRKTNTPIKHILVCFKLPLAPQNKQIEILVLGSGGLGGGWVGGRVPEASMSPKDCFGELLVVFHQTNWFLFGLLVFP